MRNKAATGIVALLVLSACLPDLASANPFMYYEAVPPPSDAVPLKISVLTPLGNKEVFASDNLNLTLTISTKDTTMTALLDAYLKADWINENTTIYKQNPYSLEFPTSWNYSHIFFGIPNGEHKIVIFARGNGGYISNNGLTANIYVMNTNLTITFQVDSYAPEISVMSPTNSTYRTSKIPLIVSINENASLIEYSVDNQANATYNENATLVGLIDGKHNVTVYASDVVGNIGSSQTSFIVQNSNPVLPTTAAVAFTILFAGVSIGVLFLFKKYKNRNRNLLTH